MAKIQVARYSGENKAQWNRFLEVAKNSTFLFDRNFMDYHKDRFRDHSLIIKANNNNLLGLLPANITADNVLYSHQGLTYGGLIVQKEAKLINFISYFAAMLKFLHENEIKTLIYKEMPAFYNDIPSDEQQYVFFLLNAKLIRRDAASTIRICLELPYQKRRVKSIKKARQLGVKVKADDNFEEFWNKILIPNLYERHGIAPVHTLEEITALHEKFPDNIRQYNAYLNGKIMAGTTMFEMPEVAHSQYFSGNAEGRRNGSVDLLCGHLISNTYQKKTFFDFGISNENNGLTLNKGLLEWKEGFGARTYSQNFYEIKTQNYTSLEKCLEKTEASI
jgi:Acetyltransferase (GNAT) domain